MKEAGYIAINDFIKWKVTQMNKSRTLLFYLFILPWLIGFVVFTAGPMVYSLYMSFTDYSGLGAANWVGLENYKKLFTEDPLFWQSLWNTFFYTIVGVPLGLVVGYMLAVLLNTKVRFMGLFRTIFYLPSLVPTVASSLLWILIFQPDFGIANGPPHPGRPAVVVHAAPRRERMGRRVGGDLRLHLRQVAPTAPHEAQPAGSSRCSGPS
ncbi:sugar ABC transporter permease [Micrococcus luteus]|uniref:carbohydrate ABC transporter permease n=1 Tax=Micrococcus luteus TaxID=1270 RepID=UPI0033C9838D